MSGTGPFRDPDGTVLAPAGATLRAAVLSVGSELLLGDLTDTNATWLSQRLRELGIEVRHHLAVRDEEQELVAALHWLADQVHVVIIGGGLGPTRDDLTRDAVAAAAGVALQHRDDLEAEIRSRFASMDRRMPEQNAKQAGIPAGATALWPVGTAPGFTMTLGAPGTAALAATRVYAVPGVPWELQQLWERDVVPELTAMAGAGATLTRVIHVVGRGESDVAEVVEPLVDDREGATLAFLARSSEIEVRLTVTADDPAAARRRSQPLVDEVVAALGTGVAGIDEETLESALIRTLTDAGQTVATAESATAGDVAARLGRVPGASRALLGGAVVYATAAKRDLLGLDPDLLATHGAVSAEVTSALAAATRARFGADWGVAVTGVAGPSTADDLPVGSCFWALAGPDGEVEVHGRRVPGDRSQVIARVGSAALGLLRLRLTGAG